MVIAVIGLVSKRRGGSRRWRFCTIFLKRERIPLSRELSKLLLKL